VHKDVGRLVGVARYQIGRGRIEGHIAAVIADVKLAQAPLVDAIEAAVRIALVAGAVHAHPLGDAGLTLVHEHVHAVADRGRAAGVVGVSRHQIVGPGREGDVAAVGADEGPGDPGVGLLTGTVHTHSLSHAGLAVVHEDVLEKVVGVVRHQVFGPGYERDVPAVGADGG
jgi:hypothetical protein